MCFINAQTNQPRSKSRRKSPEVLILESIAKCPQVLHLWEGAILVWPICYVRNANGSKQWQSVMFRPPKLSDIIPTSRIQAISTNLNWKFSTPSIVYQSSTVLKQERTEELGMRLIIDLNLNLFLLSLNPSNIVWPKVCGHPNNTHMWCFNI